MSGRIVYTGHTCDKPRASAHSRGTIWQCDCGRYWQTNGVEWIASSAIAVGLMRMGERMAQAQRPQERQP